jgi:hypothetical protein
MAPRSVCFGVRSQKLSNVDQSLDGWPKFYYLELLCASEGTLSRKSRLHLQSSAPTNSHWARVVGYDPFSLCVRRPNKEGLCPSSGDINRFTARLAPLKLPYKKRVSRKVDRVVSSIQTPAWGHERQLRVFDVSNVRKRVNSRNW